MSKDLLKAIKLIEQEKGIAEDILVEAIELALLSAYKKNFNAAKNVRVDFNRTTGDYKFIIRKDVVEEVYDDRIEFALEEPVKKQYLELYYHIELHLYLYFLLLVQQQVDFLKSG